MNSENRGNKEYQMVEIESFWQEYLASLPPGMETNDLSYTAWSFGNRSDLADELGALVLAGHKTATCTLLWGAQQDNDVPLLDGYSVILDGRGQPMCIIQTTGVEIKSFDEVDAQFAYEEGEGDRSYEHWRENHWRYFSKECQSRGWEMTGSIPVICERFRLLYVKQADPRKIVPSGRTQIQDQNGHSDPPR
jgi:uncharacterized protein YhfF